jgi:hypothetical protein
MTSSTEIDRYFQGNALYSGCCCKDQLVDKNPTGFYIVNMENSTDGPGSHWVLVWVHIIPIYADPYGIYPPPEIVNFMTRAENGDRRVWSKIDYQTLTSEECGNYCCDFANELCKYGPVLANIGRGLTDHPSAQNEAAVARIKL